MSRFVVVLPLQFHFGHMVCWFVVVVVVFCSGQEVGSKVQLSAFVDSCVCL